MEKIKEYKGYGIYQGYDAEGRRVYAYSPPDYMPYPGYIFYSRKACLAGVEVHIVMSSKIQESEE